MAIVARKIDLAVKHEKSVFNGIRPGPDGLSHRDYLHAPSLSTPLPALHAWLNLKPLFFIGPLSAVQISREPQPCNSFVVPSTGKSHTLPLHRYILFAVSLPLCPLPLIVLVIVYSARHKFRVENVNNKYYRTIK